MILLIFLLALGAFLMHLRFNYLANNASAEFRNSAKPLLTVINKENSSRETYNKTLAEVELFRASAAPYSKDSIRKYLLHRLEKDVFPAWYGTDWDFNGTTELPGEGSIACGYLVSTILKQIGFNLNRYKLARQTASNIIKSTCDKSSVQYYKSIGSIHSDLKSKPGLYIIGLDYHVGFIISSQNKVWFFHSDYFSDKVIKEEILSSTNLKSSHTYLIGNLLSNDTLLDKWIHYKSIKIFT